MTAFKRIMIFGIPGSGKSTFSLYLSDLLNLPVEHLDKSFFVENWIERDYEDFLRIQENFVNKDSWIIDGNATRSLEIRFKRADVALYFRFNRLLCLWRLFKRRINKNSRIFDRAEGCSEQIRWKLIRYPQVNVTQLFDLQADPDEMHDLAGDPTRAQHVVDLLARLQKLQKKFGDDQLLTVADPKPAAWKPPADEPPPKNKAAKRAK